MLLMRRILWLLLVPLLALSCTSCVEQVDSNEKSLAGFRVRVESDIPLGSAEDPLPFPVTFRDDDTTNCQVPDNPGDGVACSVTLDIEAIRSDGSVNTDFNGWVELRVVPGEVAPEDGIVELQNGVAEGVEVSIRYTFGPTRIWVEDTGVPDPDPVVDECSDGKDNDGNGLIDFPFDPTCSGEGDRDEGTGTFVTGIGPEMIFEPPSIHSVQQNPITPTGPSPLTGEYVEIQGREGHDLVVSNVVSTGFYVTDISDQNYNSIFVFNFSFPDDVEIGDRICEVAGGVVEFNALTQLQFPSWGIQGKVRPSSEQRVPNPEDEEDRLIDDDIEVVDCSDRYAGTEEISERLPLPQPVELTGAIIRDLEAMEKLEGSVVTVSNVELSQRFLNCDDNGSGRIEGGTPEADCRAECNDDPNLCTEISSLEGFDQWLGRVAGAEVSVSSTQLVAGFDPLAACDRFINEDGREEYTCEPRTLKRVTGSLRQIVPTCDRFLPCDPADEFIVLFVIDPRFPSDIVE